MRHFVSHKVVRAARVVSWHTTEDGEHLNIAVTNTGEPDDHTAVQWTKEHADQRFKGSDVDPGYIVEYSDGFQSWAPTKAFEEGYTPLDEADQPAPVMVTNPYVTGVVGYGVLIYALLAVWGFLVGDFAAVTLVVVAGVCTYFNMLACHALFEGEYPFGVSPEHVARAVPLTGIVSWVATAAAFGMLAVASL